MKSVSDSQLRYLGATLAQAGPARFTLAPRSSLGAETLYLALHSWGCNRSGVPHGGTSQTFMGVLALLSCGCQLLSHVSINTRFYSYLILLTSRFLKSVFFHVILLPCIPITVPLPLLPLKKEPAFVKLWTPSGKLLSWLLQASNHFVVVLLDTMKV